VKKIWEIKILEKKKKFEGYYQRKVYFLAWHWTALE